MTDKDDSKILTADNTAVDNVKIVSKGLNIPRYKKIMMWAIIFINVLYFNVPKNYMIYFFAKVEATPWGYITKILYYFSGIFYFIYFLLPKKDNQKKSKQKIIYFVLIFLMYLILVYPRNYFVGMFNPSLFITLLFSFFYAFAYTKKLRLYFPLFVLGTMVIVIIMRFFKYW